MNRPILALLAVFAASAAALFGAAGAGGQKPAEKPDPQAVEFFEAKVRPLLIQSCFGCHGDKAQQGGLRLDSLAAMLKGNSGGAVIKPGDPDKSPLIHVIRYDGKVKMPPAGKLSAEQIDILTAWVKMGAPWPGVKVSDAAAEAAKTGEFRVSEEMRKFWSFRPVVKPKVPAVKAKTWVKNPVDNFILAKLEAKGLTPSPEADRRAFIRRATFDLHGLPPTAEEIDTFVADKSPDATEKLIDRLLASPRYGERWGRLWLDVARYADTKGYVFVEDRAYPNAYTFRDYVIRAFNEDLPFDQFILHQLAADKMELGEDRRPLAAMGYLTVGRRFLNNQHDIIDDRIDVTTRGFLGLTVNCARCHDHKFDPISTKDYYSLYGVFASSTEPNPPPTISPRAISEPWEQHNAKIREAETKHTETLRMQVNKLRAQVLKDENSVPKEIRDTLQGFRVGTLPNDNQRNVLEKAFPPEVAQSQKELRQQIEELKKTVPPKPEFGMAMVDLPNPVDPRVFLRGNPGNRGPEVPRQFLEIATVGERKPFAQGSGRLELAKAIASKDNPLTARVYVNRVWRHHFGHGIVRTPSDLGTRGEPPTHPELLDWLAATFMENGWSTKKLHRAIMLSSTYRQASAHNDKAFNADPENRLVWRMNRRRLDLEQTRDSLLLVAGKLDLTMGGPSQDIVSRNYSRRRSVYGYIERQNLPGFFRTFDFANPDASSPQRFTTTIPQQALFMLNSPFMADQAKALAARKELEAAKEDEERIRVAYRLAFGRAPSKSEIQAGKEYMGEELTPVSQPAAQQPAKGLTRWERYLQALLMTNEFIFVD
jgi:cytochrome c553